MIVKKKFIRSSILFFTLFLSTLLVCSIVWVKDRFGDTTIDTIIFHYTHSLVGVPDKYYFSYSKRIVTCFFASILCVVALHCLGSRLPQKRIEVKALCLSFILLMSSITLTLTTFSIPQYFFGTLKKNTFIEENYLPARNGAAFPDTKRNVIVIILESMEKTFFDNNVFPSPLTPHLQKIAEANLSCTLYEEKNLAWTTAGLTGFLLGIPLYTPTKNYYKPGDNSFLPQAESILSIFEDNGYSIAYITGTNAEFGSIKNILTSHSCEPAIYDLSFFVEQGVPVRGNWGIGDLALYQMSKEILHSLGTEKKPFFAMLQTIDTHSKAVSFGDYPEKYHDDRDGFVAADCMLFEFLNWATKQTFYENTTIVIVGDHLYMNNYLGKQKLPHNRSIYNVFINTVIDRQISISDRQATMMDMGPSLLESVGVTLPDNGMGLGRSIFTPTTKTFVEQYGIKQLTEQLNGHSDFYNKLFLKEALQKDK